MKSLSLVLAVCAALPLSAAIPLNGIAAKVNGKAITHNEVRLHLGPIARQLVATYPHRGEQFQAALEKEHANVLQGLIENKLILSKLEQLDAKLPEAVVEKEIDRIMQDTFKGSEAAYREFLKRTGMTSRTYRESQREMILVSAFKQQQFKEVAPATDGEIRDHYNKRRHELRDRSQDKITFQKIVIPAISRNDRAATADEQSELVRKRLASTRDLAARLKGGQDFTETAIEESEGVFAAEGGFWKDVMRPDLPIGFGDIIFDAREGAIVGPVRTQRDLSIVEQGFNIVKVIKKNTSENTVTFRKIFIPAVDPDNPAATREEQLALAESLASKVKDGADFAETAIAHSVGAFAADGGLWENEKRSDLEKWFGDILFDTSEGEIVGPFENRKDFKFSREAFTIVKVIDKSYGPSVPFDSEMKKRMRREVEVEKQAERYNEWIDLLMEKAMIEPENLKRKKGTR